MQENRLDPGEGLGAVLAQIGGWGLGQGSNQGPMRGLVGEGLL